MARREKPDTAVGARAARAASPLRAEVPPARLAAALNQASHDHLALAAALDPIVTIDGNGVIQSVSNSIEALLGWLPIELIGRNVSVLMPEPNRSRHDGYLARYRQTGTTTILGRPRVLDALHRDGTPVPIELCVARADPPEGGAALFVGILHDARRRTAESAPSAEGRLHELLAEQTAALQSAHLRLRMADRMASVGTLSAGLGHDMNNVLLPVRAHLNALESEVRAPSAIRHIESVRRAVAYLQQLSDGLHFLALDPERGNLDEVTDLVQWWKQAGAILVKAVPRHVRVSASVPRGLPSVCVAPHRLTQAILNLVVNAGEAIPAPRAGRVRFWAEAAPRGRAIRLGVSDNGEGMTPEVRRRAFEIFFTTKPRGLGTGLGLALVRNIAERSGGSVDIESTVGRGTTVTMVLPVAFSAAEQRRLGAETIATNSIDDARASDLIRHLLEHAGAKVVDGTDPGTSNLWILQPLDSRLAEATQWCEHGSRRRLVLFGSPPRRTAARWRALDATIIDRPQELDAVRSGLAQALSGSSRSSRRSPP